MMYLILFIISFFLFIYAYYFYEDFRFYVLSFFFSFFNRHRTVAKLFGIRFEDLHTWKTSRKETKLYISGLAPRLCALFAGMELEVPHDLMKQMKFTQTQNCSKIDMKNYFDQITGKTLSAAEVEKFLAISILKESNRIFEIFDFEKEEQFIQDILVVRKLFSIFSEPVGIKFIIKNCWKLFRLSKLVRSLPEVSRAFLIIPQLTLVHSFVTFMIERKGDLTNLQTSDFIISDFEYLVFVNNGQLVFTDIVKDSTNNMSNKNFGPSGCSCPGSIYTIKFIQSILTFLHSYKIELSSRTGNFKNKNEIYFTFHKLNEIDNKVIETD